MGDAPPAPRGRTGGLREGPKAQGLGLSYQWMQNGVPVAGGSNAQMPSDGLRNGYSRLR